MLGMVDVVVQMFCQEEKEACAKALLKSGSCSRQLPKLQGMGTLGTSLGTS